MSMTVGALAKKAGINLETVRFYEKQKLLPDPERTSGGHRLYSDADVDRLRFIQSAKAVGFTLKEIRALARFREEDPGESCDDVMELGRRKLAEIEVKLRELQTIRKMLAGFIAACPEDDLGHCQVLAGIEKATGAKS
ncbi:MAG: heavy metal-responsive transcriptional regulator [Planctomycetes bacterium]|nr:heavy metal-responsive transcriptional regulator [Planctomycetota bacterium]